MNNAVKFAPLNQSEKEELVMEYVDRLKELFLSEQEPLEGKYYKYEITLQSERFVTYVSDEEVEQSAQYALEILEEMKNINNGGMDKVAFEGLQERVAEETEAEIIKVIKVWEVVSNVKTAELIRKIEKLCRVGGAYALLMSRPVFISACLSVFEAIVDCFDNFERYRLSGFFLFRAILKIHSEPIEE